VSVYLITLHAYRSWGPDRPRGYVRDGTGILPADPDKARMYDASAGDEPVEFSVQMQRLLIVGAADVCHRRGWRLHAVGTDPTHGHFLVSQPGFMDWQFVRDKLKNILSLFLGRLIDKRGKRWFVAKGSRKRVADREHFDYLVDEYLPGQRGLFWKEGDPLPEIPDGIL
jgi:hypothetical protein